MTNDDIYKSLEENEGLKLSSYMGIVSRDKDFELDTDKIKTLLELNKEFEILSFEIVEKDIPSEGITSPNIMVKMKFEEEEYDIKIAEYTLKGLDLQSFSFANTIDEESMRLATIVPSYLEVKTMFSDNPMVSFLFQLKVLHTISPEACLIIDFSSLRLLSPHWLTMTASSSIPPSPDYLYIIHAVYDEKENGKKYYWMHTHGLHRCGSMELELVNIKAGAEEMHNLITTAASILMMGHYKENESFQVGYDGLGINICWLRWEEALKEFPADVLGGVDDRKEEDGSHNVHSEPSGIIFAVEEGNYTSPEIYVKALSDNPIFYLRTEETLRMSALAKERFHMFEKIYQQHAPKKEDKKSFLGKLFGGKKQEESSWRFLVKLGLLTDEAKNENEKEHLWYEVQSIDGGKVTGELLNQPYWIAGLNEGDVGTYPIEEVLTDWMIYGPEASYTPDSIYALL